MVDRGAGQPQSAVAVRPVLAAAGLPLQPGALIAASARVPGQGPSALAAVRGLDRTSPEVARRALVSRERPHQKEDAQQHNGALAEHDPNHVSVSFPKQNKTKKAPLLSDDKPHEPTATYPQSLLKSFLTIVFPRANCLLHSSSLLKRIHHESGVRVCLKGASNIQRQRFR